MRDTVYCLVEDGDTTEITASIEAKVDEVRKYVPGYRLKQAVQFERYDEATRWSPRHRLERAGSQGHGVPRSGGCRPLPARRTRATSTS